MLEVAVVLGMLGMFGGMLGATIEDQNAQQEYQDYMDQIDQMYLLEQEEAKLKFDEAKRQAEKSAKEAELQADLTDKAQDITETSLATDFNTAIDDLYLSQANDTWSWNAAAINAGASTGNALAQVAGSGVRAGSSLNDAVLMESSLNSAQLQFSQDAKRRSDNNNLASVLNGLAGQKFGIYQNRVGADIQRGNAADLRNSYAEGGYNYNLYQNQLNQLETQRDYQYNKAKKEKSYHEGWYNVLNVFSAGLTSGAAGFKTGYNVGTTAFNAKTPDYTTLVK